MFASQHDLLLAIVLLVFASGIAMSVGFFLSEGLTDRIWEVSQAAERVAGGELDTRVVVRGRDEMASLAAAFNDMAARLQTSEQTQREVEALRRDLIAWVGHDLRTPLTSVRAILEALSDGLVEDPQSVQRYLHTAQGDIRSLSQLIDDLFELAQIDAGGLTLDLQPNSLGDLISDTIESFTEPARRQQVTLSGEVQRGVDPVLIDAPRVGRVLVEFVGQRHAPHPSRWCGQPARLARGPLTFGSKSATPAKAFPRKCCRTYSNAFIGEKNLAAGPPVAPDWALPSPRVSSKRMAEPSWPRAISGNGTRFLIQFPVG